MMALIETPPYDYKQEPLVTNAVNVNSENLKKTVRWLVDCVQDHQRILCRHSQLWDSVEEGDKIISGPTRAEDSVSGGLSDDGSDNDPKGEESSMHSSPRAATVVSAASLKTEGERPMVKYASESPSRQGVNSRKSFRRTFTDGYQQRRASFVNTLGGELLDMKMSAMRRTLNAELPRKGELDNQREKMLADMAIFTRDLNAKFADSDKKLHNDLAQATSKLYEQLTRISESVLERIEALEGLANSNADDLAALQESRPGTGMRTHSEGESSNGFERKRTSELGAREREDSSSRRTSVDKTRGYIVSRSSDKLGSDEGLETRPQSSTSVVFKEQSEDGSEFGKDKRPESSGNRSENSDKRPESSDKRSERPESTSKRSERPESSGKTSERSDSPENSDKRPESSGKRSERSSGKRSEGHESSDKRSDTDKRPDSRQTRGETSVLGEEGGLQSGDNQDVENGDKQDTESNLTSQKGPDSPHGQITESTSRPDSRPITRESNGTRKSEGVESRQEKPTDVENSSEPVSPKTPTRKPPYKPPVREASEITTPTVPAEISSWDEVQDTLSKVAAAQREGLEDARRDLADMAEALGEESEERLKLQDEIDALRRAQIQAQESFDELANELPGWLADQLAAWQKKQDRANGRPVSPVSPVSLKSGKSRESRPTSQASNLVGNDIANPNPDRPQSRPTSHGVNSQGTKGSNGEGHDSNDKFQLGRPNSTGSQQDSQNTKNPEASLKDLIHGAVKKTTDGHNSFGMKDKDQNSSEVNEAAKQEMTAWLHDKPNTPDVARNELDGKPSFNRTEMHDHMDHVLSSRRGSKESVNDNTQHAESENERGRRSSGKKGTSSTGGTNPGTSSTGGTNPESQSTGQKQRRDSPLRRDADDTPQVTRNHSMNGQQYISSAFPQHTGAPGQDSGRKRLEERVSKLESSSSKVEKAESKHNERMKAFEESLNALKKSSVGNSPDEVKSQVKEITSRVNELERRLKAFEDRPAVKVGGALTTPRPEPTPTSSPRPDVSLPSTLPAPEEEVPPNIGSPSIQGSEQNEQKNDQKSEGQKSEGQNLVARDIVSRDIVPTSSVDDMQSNPLRGELDVMHRKLDALEKFLSKGATAHSRNLRSAGSTTVGTMDTVNSTTVEEGGIEEFPDITETSLVSQVQAGHPDLEHIQAGLEEMVKGVRGEFESLVGVVQALQRDVKQSSGRTDTLITRLKKVERASTTGALPNTSSGIENATTGPKSTANADQNETEHRDEVSSLSARRSFPMPVLDAALDRHPADLSHLLDPQGGGGNTPLPFVSQRGLQKAVEGLTDNFRSWLDAIYQSIIAALENKADSTQIEQIMREVHEAAGRTSESVASFAKRALGGHCASCDAPLSEDSLRWPRPLPSTSSGPWVPRASAGAVHSIRPPAGMPPGVKSVNGIIPPLGPSKLPKLQDLRSSRDFPKGKILKSAVSDPQLRVPRPSDVHVS